MQPVIRDATPADKSAIFKINQDSLSGVSELDDEYFAQLNNACTLFRVVDVENVVTGYLCAVSRQAHYDGEEFHWFQKNLDDDFLYIDQVAIGQHNRRQGQGRHLYDDLERYAVRHGINTLTCEVNYEPRNVASLAFHKRRGFEEVNRMEARGLVVSLLVKKCITEVSNQHVESNTSTLDNSDPA